MWPASPPTHPFVFFVLGAVGGLFGHWDGKVSCERGQQHPQERAAGKTEGRVSRKNKNRAGDGWAAKDTAR